MNSTLIDSLLARRRAVSPWAGLYFLQSLLINLALGYPFSLLYTAAFTCLLLLLWRYLPRGQKALLGICSLVAAGAALHQYGRVERNPDHLPVV